MKVNYKQLRLEAREEIIAKVNSSERNGISLGDLLDSSELAKKHKVMYRNQVTNLLTEHILGTKPDVQDLVLVHMSYCLEAGGELCF